MASVWVGSGGRSVDEALEMLAAAVRDCPDELWTASMWSVQATEIVTEVRDSDGRPVTDPAERVAVVARDHLR
ncbi:MAG: hypothetical protein ACRDZX_04600, partial [Acidimicrobiales bacterium]